MHTAQVGIPDGSCAMTGAMMEVKTPRIKLVERMLGSGCNDIDEIGAVHTQSKQKSI